MKTKSTCVICVHRLRVDSAAPTPALLTETTHTQPALTFLVSSLRHVCRLLHSECRGRRWGETLPRPAHLAREQARPYRKHSNPNNECRAQQPCPAVLWVQLALCACCTGQWPINRLQTPGLPLFGASLLCNLGQPLPYSDLVI